MKLDETFLPIDATPPPPRADVIQVGAFEPRSLVAGPGERAVLWVAGCLRRCPSCMKPDLFAFDAGETMSVQAVAQMILRVPKLDGVTFSGGEPFEQVIPLAALAKTLKAQGLSILVYSGYRLDALRREPHRFGPLLDETDILIDGEYRRELPGPLPWRGSANQIVHHLTVHGAAPESKPQLSRQIQISLSDRGLRLSGFPNDEIETALAQRLRQRGIVLEKAPMRSVQCDG